MDKNLKFVQPIKNNFKRISYKILGELIKVKVLFYTNNKVELPHTILGFTQDVYLRNLMPTA